MEFELDSTLPSVERLREEVRQTVRNEPGVYIMRSPSGMVLYVGKSTQVRTRLLSYFRLPWPEHRHARMLRETRAIEWEPKPSEFAALLRETRLIREHLPKYNIRSARPLHRWWVITIGTGIAPRLRVQRASVALKQRDASRIIGPFSSRRPLANALRVLNDAAGLRDCSDSIPMFMNDDNTLFDDSTPAMRRTPGCHRYETGRCLGPCIGATSTYEYNNSLARARAVLEGSDDFLQHRLVREMSAASAAMSYERAGWLRDRLSALQGLTEQLDRIREALSRPNCVCAVPGVGGDHRIYLVRHGFIAAEAQYNDPDALHLLQSKNREISERDTSSVIPDKLDELWLVQSWLSGRITEAPLVSSTVEGALELLASYEKVDQTGNQLLEQRIDQSISTT